MKTIIFLLTFTFGIILNNQAQYIIPLTEEVSFFSSFSKSTVDEVLDTIVYQNDGNIIKNKKYKINGTENFKYTYLSENENSEFTIFDIESNTKHKIVQNNPLTNTDTLFVVLDTTYGWGLYMDVLIDREINYGGVAAAIWINDTLGYISNLEHGTINIAAILPTGIDINIVFRDSVIHAGKDTVFLSSDEAIHKINYEPVNENGLDFGDLEGDYSPKFSILFDLPNGGVFFSSWSWFGNGSYFISDYHGILDLYFGASLENWNSGSSSYLVEFPEYDSITQDITLSNDPDSMVGIPVNYTYYAKRDLNKIGFANFYKCVNYTGSYGIIGTINFQEQASNPYWEGKLFMDMQESDKYGYCLQHRMKYVKHGVDYPYLHSPYFDEYNDSIAGFWGFAPEEDVHFYNYDDTLFFGKGASFYWSVWSNFSDRISCVSDNMGIWGNYFYRNLNTDTYKIKDSAGNVIQEGSGLEILANNLENKPYTVELKNSFCQFDGFTGSSTLLASFDKSQYDPNPPPVSKIQLLNANHAMKYHFDFGEDVILKFSASDFIGYDLNHVGIGFQPVVDSLTSVSIKSHYSANWSNVDIQKIYGDSIIGSQFKADLSTYLTEDSAMYDLKIYVEDYSGNSSEYTFSPAFIYGNFMVGIPVDPDNIIFKEQLIVTPNPANSEILISNIEAENYASVTYEILNTTGLIVKKGELLINTSSASINISDLTNGLYIIVIHEKNNSLKMSKIIKI